MDLEGGVKAEEAMAHNYKKPVFSGGFSVSSVDRAGVPLYNRDNKAVPHRVRAFCAGGLARFNDVGDPACKDGNV